MSAASDRREQPLSAESSAGGSTSPLTVLHVNTETSWRGGEAQTLMLALGLAERGHTSLLAVARGGALEAASRGLGLTVFPLAMKGEFDAASIFGIAAVLRDARVDVLHYHTSHAVSLGTLATLIAGRRRAVLSRRVSFSLKRNPLARLKYTYRIDHLIAVADGVRWILIAEGIAPDRISVIHSGIELARFGAVRDRAGLAAELGIPADAFLVGTVGHLAAHKGQGVLVEALGRIAPEIPSLRLLVVGDGEERGRLEAQVAAGTLAGRVVFAGFRRDVPRLLAALDLLVLPSLSGEGSPAAVKEAMASGVPVIASDLDGVREIAEEGREAIMVPAGDPERLARDIRRLVHDPALRAALAQAGLARVREFSSERMVDRTLEVYQKVTSGSVGREQRRRAS